MVRGDRENAGMRGSCTPNETVKRVAEQLDAGAVVDTVRGEQYDGAAASPIRGPEGTLRRSGR